MNIKIPPITCPTISMWQNSNISDSQLKMFRQHHTENETYLSQAKESLINLLPSIMSSMTQVWQRCNLLFNRNLSVSKHYLSKQFLT